MVIFTYILCTLEAVLMKALELMVKDSSGYAHHLVIHVF